MIVTLGDVPTITPVVLARFLGAAPGTRATYGGSPGHPVVLGRAHLNEVTGLSGDRGLKGVRFPLLVDPDRRVYSALALPRKWWVSLNPRGWWNYARALARGNRQGKIIEPNQLPGLALLDADARAVWVHRGRALGDYPSIDRVLAQLEPVAAPAHRPDGGSER